MFFYLVFFLFSRQNFFFYLVRILKKLGMCRIFGELNYVLVVRVQTTQKNLTIQQVKE